MANLPPEIWREILSDVVSSYLDLAITEPAVIPESEAMRVKAILLEESTQDVDWDVWEKQELSKPLPCSNSIRPLLSVSLLFRLTTLDILAEALGPGALTYGQPPGVSHDIWNGILRARTAYRATRVLYPTTPRPPFLAPTSFLDIYTSFLFSHLPPFPLTPLPSPLWSRIYCRVVNLSRTAHNPDGEWSVRYFPFICLTCAVPRATKLHNELAAAVSAFVEGDAVSESEWLEKLARMRAGIRTATLYIPVDMPSEVIQAFRFRHIGWRTAAICRPPLSTVSFPYGPDQLRREILGLALRLVHTWTKHESISTYYRLP
ncbi:hypothetical protein C8R43DRAFT_368656 [Mycena crocata]|nr:hypothetical protein C8R43DRAFT_368656 [Mycena crocata]